MTEEKQGDKTKSNIIQTALQLFAEQGYAQTSVDIIVKACGIAKGTFYYYFKSKEELFDVILKKVSDESIELVNPILQEKTNAIRKLEKMFFLLYKYSVSNGYKLFKVIGPMDELILYKIHQRSCELLSPLLTLIIKQGIAENIFHTDYPAEVAEISMLASNFLLDEVLFPCSGKKNIRRLLAIQNMLELSLDVKPGSFSFMKAKRNQ
ncbi:TetR/AcrR family transcriptional regulator [Brucepastera parasyntrophica]|uniref:TetR/AcrR family transcriptional regulator n=1 Tax=Brucepastera parasyntrophica TaxID=2880008 RepID=UPI002109BA94|nr:TetR/AcrR family transcriptional regulator [Brucepastera parasyntrophica]ULQ59508.1 TetR/AcrR family transcriptional regulator [Brucepastera parasyntrophica]